MALASVTRIPVIRNANYVANGTKSLVWLFHKYNIKPSLPGRYHRDENNNLMVRRDDGTAAQVTTEDQQNDAFYTCPVQIGTPGQTLNVTFDSGSADFWVWSSLLPENTVSQGKSSGTVMYDPKNSSTVKKLSGSTWKIRYGDGSSASGVVVTDNVKVGDVIVEDQAIEVATKLSTQLTRQTDSHGILGLGFGVINTVQPEPVNTPLENMILQKDIDEDQELFTCYLGSYKDKNDPDQGESFYTFGGIDQQAVRASGQQISYTPIDDSDGFWKFNSSSVVINGQTMTNPSNMAIADTGTTLMLVSDLVAKAIYEAIPGSTYSEEAQGWLYPANTPADHLPTLSFAIGDTQIVIEKEHIGFALIEGTEMVYGGIQSVGNLPYNIYGDVFLKCVYAVFDAGRKRFGVVQRVDPTQDVTVA